MVSLDDLTDLPRPGTEGANFLNFAFECEKRGIWWPLDVVKQFLFDHGGSPEFLEHYSHLDLSSIRWHVRASGPRSC